VLVGKILTSKHQTKKCHQKKKKKDENKDDSSQELTVIKEVLENTQASIKRALDLLKSGSVDQKALLESLQTAKKASSNLDSLGTTDDTTEQGKDVGEVGTNSGERIIEGVFNGEKMIGQDGLEYNVPVNYASKSKLVEGDILKLTITSNGSFIYKQIGPTERQQLVAGLARGDTTGDWFATLDERRWKLLTASVTYFHGDNGDEVVILIPQDGRSNWAAVENVIKVSR